MSGSSVSSPSAPSASTSSAQAPASFPALITLLEQKGHAHLAQQLHDYVGLVRYAPPELVLKAGRPMPDLARETTAALNAATAMRWQVTLSDDEQAQPTLLEQEESNAERERQEVLDSPMVKAAFEAFPDAELAGYTAGNQRS